MTYRRERVRCRKLILRLLEKYDCTIEELLNSGFIYLTKNVRVQARKMQREGEFQTAKQILEEKQSESFLRKLGVIR